MEQTKKNRTSRRILKQLIKTHNNNNNNNYNNNNICVCVCVIICLLKASKSLQVQFTAVAPPLAEGQFLKNGVTRNKGKCWSFQVGALRHVM
jgi:hypothetical protein